MARSQRALRERRGFDISGDTAYTFGHRSRLTNPQQYAASRAAGFNPPLPSGQALPANTVAPSISGTAQEGQTLTAANGTWTGTPTPTLTRRWRRNGVAISGATAATYVPVADDIGAVITLAVTGTNDYGVTTVVSAATAAVVEA